MYGITEEQLIHDAIENSVKIMPPTIQSLGELVGEYTGGIPNNGFMPAYVISNKTCLNGAASMFYPDVLDYVSSKLGGDFLVAPSSIHEVIAVPAREDIDISQLEDTVKFVNSTQVDESDQLGDHLYKYDARTHSLESIWSNQMTNEYSNTAFMM